MAEEEKDDPFVLAGKTGQFDLHKAVGASFFRAHKKGTAEGDLYSKHKSHKDKAAHRAKWAKTEFKDRIVGKRWDQEFSQVDETLGSYLSFGSVVQALGGWEWAPAVSGAKRLCGLCAQLGGKWTYTDPFSGLQMYMKLSHQNREVLNEKWSLFETFRTRAEPTKAPAASASTPATAPASAPTPKAEVQPRAAAAASAGAEGAAPESTEKQAKATDKDNKKDADNAKPNEKGKGADVGSSPRGPGGAKPAVTTKAVAVNNLMREGMSLKGRLQKARSTALDLITTIESKEEWSWAQNAQNVGVLKKVQGRNVFGIIIVSRRGGHGEGEHT